ncbi:PAS domain S-box protein, partial [candidate division WOR-3 bacterium]|nr:PAS domain S-box protein [candidate division WOR-3 bacterium]
EDIKVKGHSTHKKRSQKLHKEYEIILDNSPAGIIKLNKEFKIEYENPEMKKILGVPPGEESRAMGMDIRDVPSVKEAGLVSILNKLMKGERISGEAPITSIYGKKTYLSYRGVPIIEDSKFTGAVLLLNDITERKQTEERYTNQLKSLIDIGNKMRMELGLETILQNICDTVVNTLGWRQVILSLRDYNTGTSGPVALAGYDKKTTHEILSRPPVPLKAVERYLHDDLKISHSYYIDHTHWEMMKDYPGGIVITPIQDLPSDGWHEKDILLIPIYGKEKILGFISPDNPVNGKRPTEDDIRLFEILADQAGIAIESSRLYAELKTSEKRYRTLVEAAREGIILVDADENITFVTRAMGDILGYSKDELMGLNLSALTTSEEFSKCRKGTEERKKDKSGKYETILYSKKGTPQRFIISAAPLFNPDGTYAASMGVLTDITEQEKIKKALQESEEKYRSVCENSLTGIYISQNGKLKFVNKQLEKLSGYSRKELLSMEFLKLVHPEDRKMVKERNSMKEERREMGEDMVSLYEFRGIRKNGDTIWFESITSSIEYEGRRALLGNLIDITERRKASLELEKYMNKLEQLNDAKSRFVSSFSHDIRSPLTTINGYTSLLLGKNWGDLTKKQEDGLHKILKSTSYINDLVDRILDLSRIESGKTTIILQKINPVEEIEKSITDFITITKEKEQSLRFIGDSSVNTAHADPKAMQRILNNLIANAIKYTSKDGKIEISLLEKDKFI